ncbi:MAG TPA: anthranilate synthase component I family protein [Candidatus Dormibacteraeota bacterium]|nr:anthranilate synthase component I family protein [Candidatus Dormibacteraeota bacterium]
MLAPLEILTDRETVATTASAFPLVPFWAEVPIGDLRPVRAFQALAGDGPGLLLEELDLSGQSVGFTIVAADPAALVVADGAGVRVHSVRRPLPVAEGVFGDPGGPVLATLNSLAAQLRAPQLPHLPTMTGGLAGLLSYEAAGLLEGLAHPSGRGRQTVEPITLMVLDRVVVFDHQRQMLVLVAHLPAGTDHDQGAAAVEELARRLLEEPEVAPEPASSARQTLAVAPNISVEMYQAGVRRIKEDIAAGEIYQAVLSRRLSAPAREGGLAIYQRLRRLNPSPAMFFLRVPGAELAGSSPEPLVKVQGPHVTTRPIAGTRRRGEDEKEDQSLEQELLTDPKELAEHAMLVDLARNDLGKVCRPGTVVPTELLHVQRFPRVMHIVSNVAGELAPERTALDALAAVFPAGTVTGAPKRRAMEIIAREEPTARGPYAGACGYLTFYGDLEFCITIRTAVVTGGQVHVQAGAGIVSDSDPMTELAETEAKASAILAAIQSTGMADPE